MKQTTAIVVFSHLRWDWVYQRPQHLMSRLARDRRVLFIEEPLHIESGDPHWECTQPEPGVTVCRAFTRVPEQSFNDRQFPVLREMVPELIRGQGLDEYVVWLYTPMALSLAQVLEPRAIVYDVMDELSAFKGAPAGILDRESQTYEVAAVVFTGGPSLYRAKKRRHPNVHCFPSSVDAAHFSKARDPGIEAPEQARLPRPRLGFFGVIDERLDIPLLQELAGRHPDWQIAMVGPVCKIDPNALPKLPNIHYYGKQGYEALPKYLAGWDVCLLPFARNDSTRFISPTKTLEYMAAEKPIVSTPITDVAEPYGDIVYLGGTPDEFIAACERALGASAQERSGRFEKMRQVLQRTSWNATAAAMSKEIERVLQRPNPGGRGGGKGGRAGSGTVKAESWPNVVIGAGPTGLSAAYHLGSSALLLERNDRVGGWCRSIYQNGFTFDFAGHIMFSNDSYVHEMYRMLLGDNVHWQDREAWIFSKGVYTRYPFQGALYGLPPQVIKECILGAIEARFGSLKKKPDQAGVAQEAILRQVTAPRSDGRFLRFRSNGNGDQSKCRLGDVKDCCGDGVLESTAKLVPPSADGNGNGNGQNGSSEPANFEEFIYRVWGAGIARHFAIPYNRKLWAVPLTEMETSWLGGRVPMPDLEEMIDGALHPMPKPMGPNARFGYPLRGGFQALMNGFLPHLKGPLRLNTAVESISPSRHAVTLSDGTVLKYDHLISTMPLPVLIRSMGDEAPSRVRAAAAGLRYVSVRCVNLGVGREKLTEKHWIYYPEDTVFHRIFVQGNASPHCNPAGGFGLTCEITYSPNKPLPCDGDALIQRCIQDCHQVGFFKPEDPVWAANQVDMPHAYVVYDHARPANVKLIREWLARQDIILAGRYSEWEYYNSDHAFLAGKKAAETVQEARRQKATARALAS